MIKEILPVELHEALQSDTPPIVIDVRDADELEVSRLEGAINIPMNDIGKHIAELDPAKSYAILCRSGKRSLNVARYLEAQGFKQVVNVATGINGWAATVDPEMKQY